MSMSDDLDLINLENSQSNVFCSSSEARPKYVSHVSECCINSDDPMTTTKVRGRQRQRNVKSISSFKTSSIENTLAHNDSQSESHSCDQEISVDGCHKPDESLYSSRSSSEDLKSMDIQSLYAEMMDVRKKKMEAELCGVSSAESRLLSLCEGTATTGVSCSTGPDDDGEMLDVWGRPIVSSFCVGTEEDDSENEVNGLTQVTMSIQVDPLKSHLENMIIPFINDHHRSEYRINGKLKPEALKTLKMIARERELLVRYFGKGRNQYAAIRKKASLWNRQQDHLKWKAEEGKRRKLLEEEARRLLEQEEIKKKLEEEIAAKAALEPKSKEICIQIDCDVEEGKVDPKMAGVFGPVPKGARGPSIETCMQTCEEGAYLCPYCEEELPEEVRLMHHPICLAQYKAKMAAVNKQSKNSNNKDKRTASRQQHRSKSNQRANRSKSRSNVELVDPKIELEQIPQNDINRMVRTLHHFDTHCVVKKCKSKGKTCDECRRSYCLQHDIASCHSCKVPHSVSIKPLDYKSFNTPLENGLMLQHRFKKSSQQEQNSSGDSPTQSSSQQETNHDSAEPVEIEPGVLRFSNKEDYRNHLRKNLRQKLSNLAARRS